MTESGPKQWNIDRIMNPLKQLGNIPTLWQKGHDGGKPDPQQLLDEFHAKDQFSLGEFPQYVEKPEVANTTDLETDDIVIAVMGPIGERSTRATSEHTVEEVGCKQGTQFNQVSALKFRDPESGRHIVLVDTPGLDGTRPKFESDILCTTSEWLVSSYKKEKRLFAILYFPRTTNNHTLNKQFKKIQKSCEKNGLHKVYFAAAIWDEAELSRGERRLKESEKKVAQEIIVVRYRKDDNLLSELVRRMIHSGPDSSKTGSCQARTWPSPRLRSHEKETHGGAAPPPCRSLPPLPVSELRDIDVHPLNTPFNIVIFGEAGVGKSSIINLIAGRDIAATSPDAWGCTLQSTLYKFKVGNQTFNIWDTIGLGEPILSVSNCLGAIEKTYTLIREIKTQGGLDLLLFCMPGSRVTTTMQYNYRLFFEVLCEERIPIAAVVTRLEDEDKMEDWWVRNEEYLVQNGLHFGRHVCVTGLRGHPKAEEGRSALESLLQSYDCKGRYPMPPAPDWFSGFLKRLHRIPRSKELKQKELEKSLQQRCLMTKADAQQLAETLTHSRKAELPQQQEDRRQPELVETDENPSTGSATGNHSDKIGEPGET